MKIGVGLPAAIPGVSGDLIIEWARRAEELGFSSLGILDRLVYRNCEPLITLTAAAAVTKRIRLMTTVLVAPSRQTGLLAKQAATLDRISSGRLTLGFGVGGRRVDFEADGESFKTRGKRFEEQLALLKSIWAGMNYSEGVGPIGPEPLQKGGPEILIGGHGAFVAPRVAKWGDGFISAGAPEQATSIFKSVKDSWRRYGRKGAPRLVCSVYFALGENAAEQAAPYLRDYYSFAGPRAENSVQGLLSNPEKVKRAIDSYSAIGTDELVLAPTISHKSQLDFLSAFLT